MAALPTVHGYVGSGFEGVRRTFADNFTRRRELGGACCIYRGGEKVVDLWGGSRNRQTGAPWEYDTMVIVYSATKGLAAMTLALAHSRGWLDYDEYVCTYWPEFAQHGKERITVRQLLAHQAGLFAFDEPVDRAVVADLDRLALVLARQKPAWEPGTRQAYHALTLGFYEGELLRRVDPLHYLALQLALGEKDSSVFDAVTPREEPLLVVLDKHADGDGRWNALITSAPRAIPVASDDHWAFFSISPSQAGTPCVGKELDIASATDSHHPVDVAAWKDHDPKTVWISRKPQHAGDAVLIDLGREAAVCGIRMSIADSWFVYPRGLTVATSADGHSWAPAFTGSTAALAIRGILDNPKDIWLDVPLRLTSAARYIRLQLDVSHKSYPWFIPDLQVIGPQ